MIVGRLALIFVACLIVTLVASEVLVRGLETLGTRLNLTDGFLGLLTALGADAPEVTAAIAALVIGAGDLGRGVVLGSNIFNLAMLLGLSALLAGSVRIRRQGLALDGAMALLTLLVVAALLLGWLHPALAAFLLLALLVPYLVLVGTRPDRVERLLLPRRLTRLLAIAASQIHGEAQDQLDNGASWLPVGLIPLALAAIVAASIGLVREALELAGVWHLPEALMGGVILAGLTSLPNAYTATRLAFRGRGAAVVSATINSNMINLVIGLALPALVIGVSTTASAAVLELAWLFGMTLIGLLLLLPARGMTRAGGAGILVLYLLFVITHVLLPTI